MKVSGIDIKTTEEEINFKTFVRVRAGKRSVQWWGDGLRG